MVKIDFGSQFDSKKKIGPKDKFGSKEFLIEKNFRSKIFFGHENRGQKKILVKKPFNEKTLLIQKIWVKRFG